MKNIFSKMGTTVNIQKYGTTELGL